jgi:hypothetical protein
MEPFWTWLSTAPAKDEVLDLFGALCLVIFAPAFVLSAYLKGPGADRLGNDPVQVAGIRHWASVGVWVFGAGLFFFGVRVLQINPLSFGSPIWLLVSALAVVFVTTRCLDWWLTVYPTERARRFTTGSVSPRADLGSRVSSAAPRHKGPETTVRS